MMRFSRPVVIVAGLVLLWQIIVWLSGAPHFILPAPVSVAEAWWAHRMVCATLATADGLMRSFPRNEGT